MLADLDRPIEQYHYEPWGKDVRLRCLSAGQFVEVMQRLTGAGEDDTAAKIAVMSGVCAYGILDPQASAQEWSDGVCLDTLMHLGNKVLAMSNRQLVAVAKKN